jgi:hypothetical protein
MVWLSIKRHDSGNEVTRHSLSDGFHVWLFLYCVGILPTGGRSFSATNDPGDVDSIITLPIYQRVAVMLKEARLGPGPTISCENVW